MLPRRRGNPKAPDIDVLARHYLALGLRTHAEVAQHVANVEDVEKMQLWSLLTLAKKMGVDADEMIRATEQAEQQLSDYSFRFSAFKGELEFDLTIAFLDQTVTRKAKVVYEHTPEWEYYDLRKKALFTGRGGSSWHVEVAAVPEEWDADDNSVEGEPYWVQMEDFTKADVIPEEVWNAVVDAIEEKCKVEDAERRRLAAAQQAAMTPGSKRRH